MSMHTYKHAHNIGMHTTYTHTNKKRKVFYINIHTEHRLTHEHTYYIFMCFYTYFACMLTHLCTQPHTEASITTLLNTSKALCHFLQSMVYAAAPGIIPGGPHNLDYLLWFFTEPTSNSTLLSPIIFLLILPCSVPFCPALSHAISLKNCPAPG